MGRKKAERVTACRRKKIPRTNSKTFMLAMETGSDPDYSEPSNSLYWDKIFRMTQKIYLTKDQMREETS